MTKFISWSCSFIMFTCSLIMLLEHETFLGMDETYDMEQKFKTFHIITFGCIWMELVTLWSKIKTSTWMTFKPYGRMEMMHCNKLDMDDIFAHTKLMTWNHMVCKYEWYSKTWMKLITWMKQDQTNGLNSLSMNENRLSGEFCSQKCYQPWNSTIWMMGTFIYEFIPSIMSPSMWSTPYMLSISSTWSFNHKYCSHQCVISSMLNLIHMVIIHT